MIAAECYFPFLPFFFFFVKVKNYFFFQLAKAGSNVGV